MKNTLNLGMLARAGVARYAVLDVAPAVESCRIAAIASRSAQKVESWAQNWGMERWFANYWDLMHATEVDAVYIPLPYSLHFEWSLRALAAAKAVICEKPGVTNERDAKALAVAADTRNLAVVEAYHYRYHPLYVHVHEILRCKRYGELRELSIKFEVPRQMLSAGNSRLQHSLGGGALLDPGYYCLNFITAITDETLNVDWAQAVLDEYGLDLEISAQLSTTTGTSISVHSSLNGRALDMDISIRLVLDRAVIEIENLFLPHLGHFFTVYEQRRTGIRHSVARLPTNINSEHSVIIC